MYYHVYNRIKISTRHSGVEKNKKIIICESTIDNIIYIFIKCDFEILKKRIQLKPIRICFMQ